MTIEFRSPEECLPPECVPMARGFEPLPPLKVQEFRAILKERLQRNDCPDASEIASVNVFERMKLMQQKTRELMDSIVASKRMPIESLMQKYDFLAIDWVYSDRLEWNGSLAAEMVKKILT